MIDGLRRVTAVKTCPACGQQQPVSAFGRNRSLPDGLSFYCRACNRERSNRFYRDRRRAEGREVRDLSWVPAGSRWCPVCQQAIALSDYAKNSRTASGFGSRCRRCANDANSAGYFYRTYGLTARDLDALRSAQGDRCAVCGSDGPEHLDHDHQTGRVRQLLCQRCNNGLGLFKDDPAVLRAAADYVEHHRENPADPSVRPPSGAPRSCVLSPGMARWRAMQASG